MEVNRPEVPERENIAYKVRYPSLQTNINLYLYAQSQARELSRDKDRLDITVLALYEGLTSLMQQDPRTVRCKDSVMNLEKAMDTHTSTIFLMHYPQGVTIPNGGEENMVSIVEARQLSELNPQLQMLEKFYLTKRGSLKHFNYSYFTSEPTPFIQRVEYNPGDERSLAVEHSLGKCMDLLSPLLKRP